MTDVAAPTRPSLVDYARRTPGTCLAVVLVLHVVVRGDVDYVGLDGRLQRRITTADRIADYRAFCTARGLTPRLLD